MWWWWRVNDRNVVAVVVEENNRNVVVVVYSFTIHEAVLKKVESGVDVGWIWGRCICGWKNI